MNSAPLRHLGRLLACLAALSLVAQPAAAQSVLRDAETEALLDDLAAPLVEAAGLDEVEIVLINDPSINAFVAGGQAIYVHSGLINAADDAGEVQGVIAHELGHITGGHIIRHGEGAKGAANITLLSMLLGLAAAAAGAGEAAMGIMSAGQRAAIGKYLAFSRVQEASADAAGVEYLSKAGISGEGSLTFFGKLQQEEFRRGISQDDDQTFVRSHPLSGDRVANLRLDYERDPAWGRPTDPQLQARFERARAKLYGYLAEPAQVFAAFPESRTDAPARLARAYAWHKQARTEKALAEADALLAAAPDDPYLLELKGQILLESGRPDDALGPLRQATQISSASPLIASMFGHALIATEDRAHFDEAERVLRASLQRDRFNPFGWRQLGVIYEDRGDTSRARLASAEQQAMRRQWYEALVSAQSAEQGLPAESPDWIRAQDIALQARAELERLRD